MAQENELERLFERFRAVTPRNQQVLACRLLDRRSREACAKRYGVPLDAWDLMFYRAAAEYRAGGRVPPGPFEAERAAAAELAAGLPPDLLVLEAHAEALKQKLEAFERAREQSPAYRRETWIRWALAAVIIALTVYFYLQQPAVK